MIHPQTIDYLAECAIIEISRIQRKAWECKEMARRLTTEAKIVLERAGYYVAEIGNRNRRSHFLTVHLGNVEHCRILNIKGGTVDNDEVVKLLNARGFDEFGVNRNARIMP